MARVVKGSGTTASERYLAAAADRTFLNLWAYPNIYRDVVVNGKRTGKELCDLLVVCGDHVIIFSDKHIDWPDHADVNIAWARWYNRAVHKSVEQIRGAERWIDQHPDRLFLDQACTQPFPFPLPEKDRRRVMGIAVAIGAGEACSKFFNGDTGSFIIRPNLTSLAHINPNSVGYSPFAIGDVDPIGSFIHVLNDVTLDLVMSELDTITDFTEYLDCKARFIRSGHLIGASGEEELLAYYLTHMDDGRHAFTHPKNTRWKKDDQVSFGSGFYDEMRASESYRRKKIADRHSYIWDRLIEAFTQNMIDGTTIVLDGSAFALADHEVAVRHMAQECRTLRRMYGGAILGVIESSHEHERAFRGMVPPQDAPNNETAYGFLTMAIPKFELEGGYEQYRRVRVRMLQAYCLKIINQHRYLKRVIGIATEPREPSGSRGSSEDLVMVMAPDNWDGAFANYVKEMTEAFDVMREGRVAARKFHGDEFPKDRKAERIQFGFVGKPSHFRPKGKIGKNDPCICGSGRKFKQCCLKK